MTNKMALVHGNFSIEREYRASIDSVFAAWANVETKARWFMGPPDRWKLLQREQDFCVGGRELLRGEFASGVTTLYTCHYHAIVPNAYIVFDYDMHAGDKHLSSSLASVEFTAIGIGTRMVFTEQAVFLDGEDGTQSREHGTRAHFERLEQILRSSK
jgi:uncharacterized protein YndB with AHSA1/START domain